jgi:gamma-glutamyl-gamma-aminobutyrate hydrolase PuuD
LTLAADSMPADLLVTATADDGTIMGIRHHTHPVEGVQFHPESILTGCGHQLIANFLEACRRERGVGSVAVEAGGAQRVEDAAGLLGG